MALIKRPEQKGHGAKVPGSEMAREQKGQGASWPGSESARVLLADSLRANWPGSEKARYRSVHDCGATHQIKRLSLTTVKKLFYSDNMYSWVARCFV